MIRGENLAPIHSRTQREEDADLRESNIAFRVPRDVFARSDGDVDGWMDGWTDALLTRGRYDALRKQRSGFGARTLPGLPACLRLAVVERVLSAVGKTDPILGRTKKGRNNARRKAR